MMPNCQNCWEPNEQTAVFLGPSEVPALCEQHLSRLEEAIVEYRVRHPKE